MGISSVDKKETADLERILGAPFSGDLPDNALKVRRNLLICSSLSILLVLSGAEIHPNPTIFGFRFNEVPSTLAPIALSIALLYFLIHFGWYAAEAFIEWRIRLTGQKVIPYTGAYSLSIGDRKSDASIDPRQATLYSWWVNHKEAFKALTDKIEEALKAYDNDRFGHDLHGAEAKKNRDAEIATLEETVKKLNLAAGTMVGFTPRLSESLKRFDDWVGLSLRVQSRRWIVLDLVFPISVGCAALGLLMYQVLSAS